MLNDTIPNFEFVNQCLLNLIVSKIIIVNSSSFDFHRYYFNLHTLSPVQCSRVGELLSIWISKNHIHQVQEKEKKKTLSKFVYILHKARHKSISRHNCPVKAKKYILKCDADAELLFC